MADNKKYDPSFYKGMRELRKQELADLEASKKSLREQGELVGQIVDRAQELNKAIGGTGKDYETLIKHLGKHKDTSSAINTLSKQIVQAYTKGDEKLAESLDHLRNIYKMEERRSAIEKKISKQLDGQVDKLTDFAKQIPLIGGLISDHLSKGAKNFAKELSNAAVKGQSGMKGIGNAASKAFGKGGVVLLGLTAIGAGIAGLVKMISGFDQAVADTAKSLGMGKDAMWEMSTAAVGLNMTQQKYLDTVKAINTAFGGINVINQKNNQAFGKQIKLAADLQSKLGLSADEAGMMLANADLMGTSLEVVTYEVMKQAEELNDGK